MIDKKQGRIHGQYHLRTGGQGRKCAFSHFPTRSLPTDQWTDGPTDQRTDGRTKPLIELRVRNYKYLTSYHSTQGACIRIEKEAPGLLPFVYFACRRHKLERDLNAVWRTAFPGPTTAPTDELCERVWKHHEAGNFPDSLDESCPHVLPSGSKFFPRAARKSG